MASGNLRKEFLEIVGNAYEQYGYPKHCGWIEGLLLLDRKEWTQKGLSDRLSELFSSSTSIPSINRALKILETYGIVEKAGSRKIGFTYRLQSSSNLILSMFQQLLLMNKQFIATLESLETKNKQKDPELRQAIRAEMTMTEIWNKSMEQIIELVED